MHRLALVVLLVACEKEEKGPPPPPPAPTPTPTPSVAPKVIDAPPAVDALVADTAVIDASTEKTGGVKGIVMYKDTTPADSPPWPVPNCKVYVVNAAKTSELTTKTDAKGEYRMPLSPDTWKVDLSQCNKGHLDCGNPNKQPVKEITIVDGKWETFNITSQSCTKCLDASAPIATPDGPVAIDHLRVGDRIYVVRDGERVVTTVAAMQRVAATNQARRFVLADGRVVVGSAPHPLGDGRAFGAISVGDVVDGARVERVELVPYRDGYAYDLLPAIDGAYLVDGVPVRSTMSP